MILVVVVGAIGLPVAAAEAFGDATVAADVAGRAVVAVAGETVADLAAAVVLDSAVAVVVVVAPPVTGFLPRICATSSGIGYGFLNV